MTDHDPQPAALLALADSLEQAGYLTSRCDPADLSTEVSVLRQAAQQIAFLRAGIDVQRSALEHQERQLAVARRLRDFLDRLVTWNCIHGANSYQEGCDLLREARAAGLGDDDGE